MSRPMRPGNGGWWRSTASVAGVRTTLPKIGVHLTNPRQQPELATTLRHHATQTPSAQRKFARQNANRRLERRLPRGSPHRSITLIRAGRANNPAARYTQAELGGGRLKILANGNRQEMLRLERNLHSTMPIGPEEGQQIYLQIQAANGLTLPPY